MLELRQKDAELLLQILAKHVPQAEVWGYGSRLKGTSHSASDIDLVLRNSANLAVTQAQLVRLKEALSESNLPFLVDVMDWARIPVAFQREIEASHCVVQCAQGDIESAT